MTCPHKFTKFKQHGIERTYTCELCDMDIDGDIFDYIASLKRDMEKLLPFVWACIGTRYDWHGSEMFDLLAQHKLMEPHTAEKPCQKGGCNCSEYYGDDEWPVECWRPTIDPPQEPSDANRRRRAQP